jgi:S-formylglutathione hydrolase FrmB
MLTRLRPATTLGVPPGLRPQAALCSFEEFTVKTRSNHWLMDHRQWAVLLTALWLAATVRAADPQPFEFRITFDPVVSQQPFTGRVYVMLSRKAQGEPRFGPNWFQPEPFFAREVERWQPGEPTVIDHRALGFPGSLRSLTPGNYSMQAVMDFKSARDFSNAPGNGYSKVVRAAVDPATTGPVELRIDQVVIDRPFIETDRVKLVELESQALTRFHGRPIRLRAGVVLPASFAPDSPRRYPVIYEIPGFGGNHFAAFGLARRGAAINTDVEMIHVMLDPDCPLGHHVFADSDNNGPYGRALTEELIPHIEQKFPAIAQPAARLLTGHSSGGWSSLWLQITYPDFFGGVWSTAPDPVDFRDFQRIDLYGANLNMFTDEAGVPRPIARIGGRPILYFKSFSHMETVMGHGGQLGSFEAVFSPRGSDGNPQRLWDRETGKIDPDVAKSWERYDIRLVLERNWEMLGPKLRGKLHVFTGSEDTFYLEGAVVRLRDALERLGSDAVVEIVPGRDHGNLLDAALRARIAQEMAASFKRHSSP